MIEDTLFIIPARGGSKGLPRKNIIGLAGKPLIYYAIDAARGVTSDLNICLSTDDDKILRVAQDYGLSVPFIRPKELASDASSSREVILHAIKYYRNSLNKIYSRICLLQPTSPFRTSRHILDSIDIWTNDLDMVVSTKFSKANPYYNLFEEDKAGFLRLSKSGNFTRRQDVPPVWEYNGAIYLMKVESIEKASINDFKSVRKFEMDDKSSIDIDSELDLKYAEIIILESHNININKVI
jgi:CMP-N,N'-diacetyllegionaminic acid synthase